jgi:hypothetical protein
MKSQLLAVKTGPVVVGRIFSRRNWIRYYLETHRLVVMGAKVLVK